MTIQDLKTNRNEIIEAIKENYSHANITEFMSAMVRMLPMAESTNTIDYVAEVGDLIFEAPVDKQASGWLAEKNRENAMNNLPSSLR